MIKLRLAGILFFLPLLLTGQVIKVRPVKQPAVEAVPGSTISLSFSLLNPSESPITLTAVPELPSQWKEVLNPGQVTLGPGDSSLILMAYRIPMNCRSGLHSIKVYFLRAEDQQPLEELIFTQSVAGRYELELSLTGMPSYVLAGERVQAELMIRNHGNRGHEVYVGTSLQSDAEPLRLILAADSFVLLPIIFQSPPDILKSQLQGVNIHVTIPEASELRYSLFEQLRVVPSRHIPPDLYHRFPLSFGLYYLRTEDARGVSDGFQADLQGQGSLDVNGSHQLHFRARGPNQFGMSNLGSYDEYFVTYTNPWLNVGAGDQGFTITPLMEANRFGRGLSTTVKLGTAEAGVLTYSPRFYPEVERVNSAFLGINRSGRYRARLNWMNKELSELRGTARLVSAEAGAEVFRFMQLEGEYSSGELNGRQGQAWRGQMRMSVRRFDGLLAYMHAGQYYPGYYTNTENYQANLTFRVTQRINLGINLHRDFQNAALDTLVYAAPRTERVQAFLGLTLPSGILLNLRAGRREQEDRLEPRLFHYAEDFLHLTLSRNGARWGLDVQGEVSETRNLLMGPAQASSGFMLHGNLSYRPSGWLNLSMFLAHSGNTRYSADLASYWYYGGSARMDIRKRTRFFITARNSFETSEYYRDRSYLESGLIQAVGRHHEVVLSGQYGSRQGVLDKPTWSYRIGYALKLGVPLKRTTEANASITGTISPGSSSINPQGLVLHLNGYTAVTDAQGRYAFYNMKAGDYFLVIDRESMPVNAVPSIPQAYPVSVAPGEERILDFRLQAGGAIHGQLRMNGKGNGETHTPEENRAFTEQHFVIVEVSGPQGSQRTITSKDGHFRFFPLYPGEYELKVYRNGMPKDYQLEAERFTLELGSGEVKEINLILVKREKIIRFQDQTIEVKVNKK